MPARQGKRVAVIRSNINPRHEDFRANEAANRALVAELKGKVAKVKQGGPPKARERHLSRNKLLPRDRIRTLVDPGAPFLEIGQLAALDMYDNEVPSAGVITGIGTSMLPIRFNCPPEIAVLTIVPEPVKQ